MLRCWAATLPLLFALTGCSDAPVGLTVDVLSDWEPGLDFISVETTLSRTAGAMGEIQQETYTTTGSEAFLDGVRVAEFDDVGQGPLFVHVALLAATGSPIATRETSLELDASFAVTLLLTRSCRDVECPAPMGAPELSECQGGSCVDPRCSPSTPEFCPPPECVEDAQCVALLDWCTTTPLCRREYCFCPPGPVTPPDGGPDCTIDAECGDPAFGDWSACEGFPDACAETGGMRSRDVATPTCTAGACADVMSAETETCDRDTDGTTCDDGDACTTPDACGAGTCSGPARPCDDGNACTADACDPGTGCTNTPMAEHSVCGAAYQRCCGGACVDTRSSTAHCGGCGINCASGFACVRYSGRTVCECTANTQCPGGTQHICSPTYDLHCGCRDSTVCPGPMTCVDVAGALNYCTY